MKFRDGRCVDLFKRNKKNQIITRENLKLINMERQKKKKERLKLYKNKMKTFEVIGYFWKNGLWNDLDKYLVD